MKRKIVLVASLVAGLVAAILTQIYLSAKDAEVADFKNRLNSKYETIDVLCLLKEVPSGTVIRKSDLGVRSVPKMGINGQALTPANQLDIIGRKILSNRKRGDVIFWSDIEGGNLEDKGLSADIKKQMRAVSINCSGAASVSGMVRPNDHVDVIGTFDLSDQVTAGKREKSLVTCTILQNVLVLATGTQTAKARTRGFDRGYSTVTLEVTPREAEMLAFAEQIKGRLVLTLRNSNDYSFERELPKVDFEKIRDEIEELNLKRNSRK